MDGSTSILQKKKKKIQTRNETIVVPFGHIQNAASTKMMLTQNNILNTIPDFKKKYIPSNMARMTSFSFIGTRHISQESLGNTEIY